jgi:hypothetical protein
MLSASAHEFGWKTVLIALAARRWSERQAALETMPVAAEPVALQSVDDDKEPFHLDDTEMTSRLSGRVAVSYTTPPHAHLIFPMLGRMVR